MADLLFWFLVGQTVASLPVMAPGTEVRLVSQDLLTIYASARVENGELVFVGSLQPGQVVRLIIFSPGADATAQAQALSGNLAPSGVVTADGLDILVQFAQLEGPLSFRRWLGEERSIRLVLPAAQEGR